MTASLQEVQQRVDALLEVLGVRLACGQIVLHVEQFAVRKVATNSIHTLSRAKKTLDTDDE